MKPWQELTDMFLDEDIIQEMKKKYGNTYLGITNIYGKTYYAKYIGFKDDKHLFQDKYANNIILNTETDNKVFIPKLNKQLANTHTGRACFVVRNPYRQYRRGINHESHYIAYLENIAVVNNNNGSFAGNMFDSLILDVLENKDTFPTLDTAIQMCETAYVCAISKDFAIMLNALSENEQEYMLCLYNIPIAILNVEKKTIHCHVKEFQQEITDNFKLFPNYFMV